MIDASATHARGASLPTLRVERLVVGGRVVAFRAPRADDEPLLVELHRLRFIEENGLPDPLPRELSALALDQLRLERIGWAAQFPTMRDHVLEIDGVPGARIAWATLPTDLRLVEASFLPEHRALGICTAFLREACAWSAAHGITAVMHVRSHGRPRRHFERLGFGAVFDDGILARLERAPVLPAF